jgi:tRNA(fMet)-specific endonuclease VapC
LTYLLDTNIVIFFFKGKYQIDRKILDIGTSNCFISEITLAELKYGALHSSQPQKHLAEVEDLLKSIAVLPITAAIDTFAKEKTRLRNAGNLIDDFDLLIGATAIAHDLTLVTNNTKHFDRLDGLEIEDWTK